VVSYIDLTWERLTANALQAWIIPVEIYEDNTKRKMMSTTSMEWKEFKKRVFARLDSMDVKLLYRICSDGPAWSELACEADFTAAMVRAADKALVARTRVVTIDIKNKVSNGFPTVKMYAYPYGCS
jgi:hypothetical protein